MGHRSQKYIGSNATVSVNPDTGQLIQCNPTDSDMVRRLNEKTERKFELTKEQIDFLKTMYPKDPLIQRVLNAENNGSFVVDVDTKIDFMDFVEDESIYWMDKDQEPSDRTYILEGIRDAVYYQTN